MQKTIYASKIISSGRAICPLLIGIFFCLQPALAQNLSKSQNAQQRLPLFQSMKKKNAEPPRLFASAKTLHSSKGTGTTYTFTGKGSWDIASNWQGNNLPPAILKAGDQVVINGNGACVFNNKTPFIIEDGSSLEIIKGKELFVSIGNNIILKGGTITNNGKLSVLSGNLSSGRTSGHLENAGQIRTSRLSKVSGDIKPVQTSK